MPPSVTQHPKSPVRRGSLLLTAGLLVVILGGLFGRAFLPGYTVFSNDGPLGAISARAIRLPDSLTGVWQDLNWAGTHNGALFPHVSSALLWALGPVLFSKLYAPCSLLFVGLAAWFCFRQWRFAPAACVLGGLAAALNGDFLGTSCWGVCGQTIAFGLNFLALGALADTTSPRRWLRVALAGAAVGIGVMEAADIGALFSVVTGAFVVFQALAGEGGLPGRMVRGATRLVVVSLAALLVAAAALSALIGTQIKGVAGLDSQDAESREARWDWATQWSLPKAEALNVVVPGLFGYRMDTPDGGAYWGRAGSDPAWDRYFASGKQGPLPGGFFRYGAGGGYAGQLVLVLAVWAVVQSLRRQGSVFEPVQRRLVWFWVVVALVALLLMFGRFAPFYRLFYALPFASTMRNPAKFLHILEWSLLILFAHGAHGLWQRYVLGASGTVQGLVVWWRAWWRKAGAWERRWVTGSAVALGLAVLGWMVYAASRGALENYLVEMHQLEALQHGGQPDVEAAAALAHAQAGFSLRQVGWFILFLTLSLVLVAVAVSGYWGGARARAGAVLLGVVLVTDLALAGRPWVVIYNWKEKYLEAGDNPVIAFLRAQPPNYRVSVADAFLPPQFGLLAQVYRVEWLQHLFQYFNIQSPDIIQMPRMPVDVRAFETAMLWDRRSPEGMTNTLHRVWRRWELMSTRYLLGAAGMAEALNRQVDPHRRRFREVMAFEFYQTRAGGPILTRTNATGPFAVMEFTGALPKARLYAHWQVQTNTGAALALLASRDFDPESTVLVDGSVTPPTSPATNAPAGTAAFLRYAPKRCTIRARADVPSVLLLNDKYDPNWRVTVDGRPAPLLRCNAVMRGVQLAAGEHEVEFRFAPPTGSLWVSLAALSVAALVLAWLLLLLPGRRMSQ